MSSFETDFPSLKGYGSFHNDYTEWFTAQTIWEYCIDKAKLKEAIEKLSNDESYTQDVSDFMSILKRELGVGQ